MASRQGAAAGCVRPPVGEGDRPVEGSAHARHRGATGYRGGGAGTAARSSPARPCLHLLSRLAPLLFLALPATPPALAAQQPGGTAGATPEATATPEGTARLFLRSLRAIRWDAAARLLHPSTLGRFHSVVTAIANADTTGQVRATLTGTADPEAFAALPAEEVFARSVGTMIDSMPGLMHALFDRDDRVVGHVAESADTAHVVYRSTPRLSGAVSEVNVMQLTRTPEGWRIQWSDELQVLDTALRGFARPTRPPPPPSSAPPPPR